MRKNGTPGVLYMTIVYNLCSINFIKKSFYIIKCGKSPSFSQISSVLSMIEAEPKDYHLNPHCILHAGTPFNLSIIIHF